MALAATGAALASAVASAQVAIPQTQPAGLVQDAQRAAAAASASGAGTTVTTTIVTTGAATPRAPDTGAISPLPVGRGPTIDALAAAQRAEIDADVRKRMTKVLEGGVSPAPAPASAPVLSVLSFSRPVTVARIAVDTTKTVVAIYGPVGQEMADIRMPDGSVVSTKAGALVAGFEVLHVGPNAVELVAPGKAGKSARAVMHRARHASHAPEHEQAPVVRHAKRAFTEDGLQIEPAEGEVDRSPSTGFSSRAGVIHVVVGGSFK